MKKHISITVAPETFELAQRLAEEEQRSVSQVFERAVRLTAERRREGLGEDLLPSTEAAFAGRLERADAYGDRV